MGTQRGVQSARTPIYAKGIRRCEHNVGEVQYCLSLYVHKWKGWRKDWANRFWSLSGYAQVVNKFKFAGGNSEKEGNAI